MDVQHFEQAILKLAFETETRITAASVAYYLGIPSREANRLLNELLREGVLELESDLEGNLYFQVPHRGDMHALAPEQATPPAVVAAPPSLLSVHLRATTHDEVGEVISPRAHRPPSPHGGSDGVVHAPAPAQRQLDVAREVLAAEAPRFDHPAVQRHQPERRSPVVGVARSMEPDAWVGQCGASQVLVQSDVRCEPKPLAEARPMMMACVDADEEARQRALHFEPRAPQQPAWWQEPSPHSGALVLANSHNLPMTMDHIEQPEHQPGMALLLSLILCGTGQIYNGEVSKGIMMMVLCFLLWFVLLGWVVHIWSIVDAVVVAERINRRQHSVAA